MTGRPAGASRGSDLPWLGLLWLLAAVAAGAMGLISRLRPPGPQILLAGATIALLVRLRISRSFRNWVERLGWRRLMAPHLLRLVGAWFLWLARRGELAPAFAVPAGIGDLVAALGALGLVISGGTLERRRRLLLAWNLFGFADILFVVAAATRQTLAAPESMAPLFRLPLSLLPTFVVPLIIVSHLVLFQRLRKRAGSGGEEE